MRVGLGLGLPDTIEFDVDRDMSMTEYVQMWSQSSDGDEDGDDDDDDDVVVVVDDDDDSDDYLIWASKGTLPMTLLSNGSNRYLFSGHSSCLMMMMMMMMMTMMMVVIMMMMTMMMVVMMVPRQKVRE